MMRNEFARHWRTLTGCTVATTAGTIGLASYTGGAFLSSMSADNIFDKTQVALGTLVLSIMIAVSAPVAGMAMDRWGAWRVIGFSVIGETAGFLLLSVIPADVRFYLGGMVMLGVLGVGTTPPSYARVVTSYFDENRGLALGILVSGIGVLAIVAPPAASFVLAQYGWRVGYQLLALLSLVMGGIGLLIIDRRPASVSNAAATEKARTLSEETTGWSGLRQPKYWIIIAGVLMPAVFGIGYAHHLIALMRERGLGIEGAALMQSLLGVALLAGRLVSGACLDRFPAERVSALFFGAAALGCAALTIDYLPLSMVGVFALGLTLGSELDILAFLISRHFGLDSFGRLYGLGYGILVVGIGSSSLLISLLAGAAGYNFALIVSALGTAVGAAIILCLKRPEPTMSVLLKADDLAS